jgi:hypothetical protein
MPNELTAAVGNIERLESMRTPLHQRHHQRKIFLVKPHPNELPEVDTAREGQQPMGDGFHSSPQAEFERSGKHGCARRRQPIGTIVVVVGQCLVVDCHSQVLEEWE